MANKRNRRRGNNNNFKNLVEGKQTTPSATIPDIVYKPWYNTIVHKPLNCDNNTVLLTLTDVANTLVNQLDLSLSCPNDALQPGDVSRAPNFLKLKIRGMEFWSMPENLGSVDVNIYTLEPSIAATSGSAVMTVEYPVLKNLKDTGTRVSPAKIGYWYSAANSTKSLSSNLNINIASISSNEGVVAHIHVLWKLDYDTPQPDAGMKHGCGQVNPRACKMLKEPAFNFSRR
jgi:hypothetical protein